MDKAMTALIYLDDYADEVLPVTDCTPQGWANWLAGTDADWGRDAPAVDGDQFRASSTRFEADLIARRTADGWTFSRIPEGQPTFFACRYGPGLGWAPDAIVGSLDDLRQWLSDNGEDCADEEHVAVGYEMPPMMATFRMIDGKPSLTLEPVQ
jgi:hypothetical protein